MKLSHSKVHLKEINIQVQKKVAIHELERVNFKLTNELGIFVNLIYKNKQSLSIP